MYGVPLRRLGAAILVAAGLSAPMTFARAASAQPLECALQRFVVDSVFEGWLAANAEEPQAALNLLALSAGGETGAFGGGFLQGWRDTGASAKPNARDATHIVTGVSAGALLASHAFVHEDDYLYKELPKVGSDALFRPRLWSLPWSDALTDSSGKDREQSKMLSSALIDRIAKAADERPRRFLYVGVTDLNSGQFLMIDMVRLARTIAPRELRDACYRAVIGASTAIPVLLGPKRVDTMLLADGALRQHLFVPHPPRSTWPAGTQLNIVALLHRDLDAAPSGIRAQWLMTLPIALRTAAITADEGLRNSVRAVEMFVRQLMPNTRQGKVSAVFYAAATAAVKACQPQKAACGAAKVDGYDGDTFCVPHMQCLAEQGRATGRAMASGSKPWMRFEDLKLDKPALGSIPAQLAK